MDPGQLVPAIEHGALRHAYLLSTHFTLWPSVCRPLVHCTAGVHDSRNAACFARPRGFETHTKHGPNTAPIGAIIVLQHDNTKRWSSSLAKCVAWPMSIMHPLKSVVHLPQKSMWVGNSKGQSAGPAHAFLLRVQFNLLLLGKSSTMRVSRRAASWVIAAMCCSEVGSGVGHAQCMHVAVIASAAKWVFISVQVHSM